jgi:hypothetical protein
MLPQQPPQSYGSNRRAAIPSQDFFTSFPPRTDRHWGSLDNSVNGLGLAPAYRSADSPYPHPGVITRPRSQSLNNLPPPPHPVARSRSLTLEEGGISPLPPRASGYGVANSISRYIKGIGGGQTLPTTQEEAEAEAEASPSSSRLGGRSRANSDTAIFSRSPSISHRSAAVSEDGTTWSENSVTDVDEDEDSTRQKTKFAYDKAGNKIVKDAHHVRIHNSCKSFRLICFQLIRMSAPSSQTFHPLHHPFRTCTPPVRGPNSQIRITAQITV